MGISLKWLTHKPKQPPKDPGNATPRIVVEDFEIKNGVRTLKRITLVSYGLDRNP